MIAAIRQPLAVALSIVSVGAWLTLIAPAAGASAPPCVASTLTLRLETGDGRFTGMSHDGAIAVVRNVGATACALPALPSLALLEAGGTAVASGVPPAARFLHPGPVVFPIELDPGEIAAAKLRWIVGNVFGQARAQSVTSASLALAIGGGSVTAPLAATVWARSGGPVTFDEDRFTTALPPLGTPSKAAAGTFVGEGPAESTYVYPHNQPARRLVVRDRPNGTLGFSFVGLGGSAPSTGSIAGPLAVHGSRATFQETASDCELAISFYGSQLAIVQTGSCGFGNGVTATGQYREL